MSATRSYPAILPLFTQKPGLAEKFHSKVARREPDRCWPWLGASNRDGYGHFRVGTRTLIASRVAAALAHGEPNGVLVCHSCDNPICCNPSHLWFGSDADNVADCKAKGRKPLIPGTFKLLPEQVKKIHASTQPRHVICRLFDVSESTVSRIKSGKCWGDITRNEQAA